jgi:hypothetical protein
MLTVVRHKCGTLAIYVHLHFEEKKAEKGPNLKKLIPSSFLSNSKEVQGVLLFFHQEYYYFSTHKDKNIVFLKPKFLQKVIIAGGTNLRIELVFSAAEFLDWPKSFARSWQHQIKFISNPSEVVQQ